MTITTIDAEELGRLRAHADAAGVYAAFVAYVLDRFGVSAIRLARADLVTLAGVSVAIDQAPDLLTYRIVESGVGGEGAVPFVAGADAHPRRR